METVTRMCSIKKGVHKNLAIFKGKYLCQSLFLMKLQASGFKSATLIKRDSVTSVFL